MKQCVNCGTQNPDQALFCLHCSRPFNRLQERTPRSFIEWFLGGARGESERRPVTMLACDIVNSTPLAERMDPEGFLELINRAFEVMMRPIFDNGGYLARLEGDGFKAFFGAPEAHDDDPLRAVRAGLEIQAGVKELRGEFEQNWGVTDFAVRVGVNTDQVIVGPAGTGSVFEYTAMGLGIALTARLQSSAKPGTVLISEQTYRLVEPYIEAISLGSIQVRGKSDPVNVFEVVDLRQEPQIKGPLGVRSPLVGRNVEVSLLKRSVDKLLEGQGGILIVSGEAGIGKSRLVAEVRDQTLLSHPEVNWLEGRAFSQGQESQGVLANLLRHHLQIGAQDKQTSVWDKLQGRLHVVLPDQAEELAPHLANLLSLRLEGDTAERVAGLDPEGQERQIFRALRLLISQLADQNPLVIALDDLHWADDSSVRLLQGLMELTQSHPLLFIFSFRPEPQAGCWRLRDTARQDHSDRSVEIALHGLNKEAGIELIDNLMESESLPASIHELIRERAEGNPMFVEEVIRSWIDRGVLERSGERWRVSSQVSAYKIPDSLHGVILARLDRLDAELRRILQMAAVIGRTFSYPLLAAVTQTDGQLDRQLDQLQRVELVRQLRDSVELAYAFKHSLTRQVAYDTLLHRQRRKYHHQVAECIESLYSDRLEEQYERLAYHYTIAETWESALTYHLNAGQQAQRRYANAQATSHYHSACEIIDAGHAGGQDERQRVQESRGDLALLDGSYQQAAFHYQTALKLALSNQASAEPIRLLRKLGNVHERWGKYEQGIEYLREGLEMAGSLGVGAELATLYASMGQIYYRQGRHTRAVELGSLALEIFEKLEDRRGAAQASNLLGISYWAMDDMETAITYHEKSLMTRASLGDVYGLAASYNNLGRVLADQGAWEQALNYYKQSQNLCLEIGYQHGLAATYNNMGDVYQQLGQIEEALTCLEKSVEIYARIGLDEAGVQTEMWKMQVW